MIEALLWEADGSGGVICRLCAHQCRIEEGKTGICRVRKNLNGRLFSLNADRIVSINVDPIEKKPLYHFLPGSHSLSIAAMGCNFACRFCQNDAISMVGSEEEIQGDPVAPEQIVAIALKNRSQSISYTYTEPTVFFELALKTAELARDAGIRNVWVSNGYMSGKTLSRIGPFLDGANIDLKSFRDGFYQKYCSARLQPVLETISTMKAMDIWVEATTLLIPGLNDDRREISELISFLLKLDENLPWHVSRFFPHHRLMDVESTPASSIHAALQLGADMGLRFVYGGNLPDSSWSNTRCPSCGRTVITRSGYCVDGSGLKNGACRFCGKGVPGIWE